MTTRRATPRRAARSSRALEGVHASAEPFMEGARVVYHHRGQRRVVTVVKQIDEGYEAVWDGRLMGVPGSSAPAKPSQLVYFKPSAVEEVMHFGDLRPGALVLVQGRDDEQFVRVSHVDPQSGTFEGAIVPPDGSIAHRALALVVGRLALYQGSIDEVLEVVNPTDAAEFIP